MSATAVRSPTEYESQLQRYLFERSEEGRAVRVGEKEVSEQAAIVARYADLFSREQLDALRSAEDDAEGDERERLYRLRKACEAGLLVAELAERDDALENAILAARVTYRGEELPLRSAQARLAILTGYADRDELGELHADASATFNDARLELVRAAEELEAELSGQPDPVARSEEEKGISLRELEGALVDAAEQTTTSFVALRERWFDRLLGSERDEHPTSHHSSFLRRMTPLDYPFRRLARDHALTEIYSYILEAITREPAWHAEYFGLSDQQAAENAEATVFLEALLYHRYVAKLRFELGFWSRFAEDGGKPVGYAELLSAATGMRYRADGFLADMDAGFYSADYLRAWIRSTQLRAHLVREIGEHWWRSTETGELLRGLFFEGTKPSSEEIAARLGYTPLDTEPLVHELNAV